jgi:hypothetical protein
VLRTAAGARFERRRGPLTATVPGANIAIRRTFGAAGWILRSSIRLRNLELRCDLPRSHRERPTTPALKPPRSRVIG